LILKKKKKATEKSLSKKLLFTQSHDTHKKVVCYISESFEVINDYM